MKQEGTQEPVRRSYGQTMIRITLAIVFFAAVIFMMHRNIWSGYAIPQYDGTIGYTEDSWIFRHGKTVLESQVQTPAFRHMKQGDTYSISTILTYDGSADRDPTCFYFVDHMYTRALLDGEELFRYMPQDVHKLDRAKSPGNIYAAVQLPHNCRGKILTIEFIPAVTEHIELQLPNPTFDDYSTAAVRTFWSELPHNIIAILSVFLGFCSILFSILALKGSRYREGLFIGIFAMLFGFYNFTESDFDFYVISNPYYTYVLDYTCFTLIPIFMIAFLRERLDPRQRAVPMVIILFSTLMFAVEVILHVSGIWDMREFLPILHVVYFLDFLVIFGLLVTMRKNRWKRQLTLQMIPILFGMLMDAAVYYEHWQLSSSDSTFTAIGVIIFLVAELYHVWRSSIEVYTESIRSQEYQQMAFVDALTGIRNRRGFDAERESILKGEKQYRSLIVGSVDLNNLKIANDTLGHAAGDFLIRNAAQVLSDLTQNYGSAYRIGGDEFAVFLYDISDEQFEERLRRMDLQIREINSNSEAKLSLAQGYEHCKQTDVDVALNAADKKMYLHKSQMKSAMAMEK